jgi:dihydrofolate reductase
MGHHLIMGRATYESIGRLLPGRTIIVITRRQDYRAPGCLVVHSIKAALDLAESRGETETFIIGGAQIYSQSLHLADRIYLTQVHTVSFCDVFFPTFDPSAWQEIERKDHPADPHNEFPTTYRVLVRKTAG